MDLAKIELLKQKIEDAELVLIGIGEEWEIASSMIEEHPIYQRALQLFGEESPLLPFVKKSICDDETELLLQSYRKQYIALAQLLEGKNSFVVSLCMDNFILAGGLKKDRIVQPCGTYDKLQCVDACHSEFYEIDELFMHRLKNAVFTKEEIADEETEALLSMLPRCPKCGKQLVFNTIMTENYLEAGYLDRWNIYTKWLQGTVNRKTCIVELGVGMRFPTVIRWPFEKIAYFNQKASFFRVHSKLYQTTEEIKERSYAIKACPEEFIRELSNKA